jgi:hypothetical protein
MMLIEGKLPQTYSKHASTVSGFYLHQHAKPANETSKHYWINSINEPRELKASLEALRDAPEIVQSIQAMYPQYRIVPVQSSDEVYISVDPSKRKNSDVSLSDCHYDAPFKYVYQCNNYFIRVILALNKNETTYTTIGDKTSRLSTLDYNGMDYNRDFHCVKGHIPPNQIRVLLKLHFMCIHPSSSETCATFTRVINDQWTHISRELMRASINPTSVSGHVLSYIVDISRKMYNHHTTSVLSLAGFVILLCVLCLRMSQIIKNSPKA